MFMNELQSIIDEKNDATNDVLSIDYIEEWANEEYGRLKETIKLKVSNEDYQVVSNGKKMLKGDFSFRGYYSKVIDSRVKEGKYEFFEVQKTCNGNKELIMYSTIKENIKQSLFGWKCEFSLSENGKMFMERVKSLSKIDQIDIFDCYVSMKVPSNVRKNEEMKFKLDEVCIIKSILVHKYTQLNIEYKVVF